MRGFLGDYEDLKRWISRVIMVERLDDAPYGDASDSAKITMDAISKEIARTAHQIWAMGVQEPPGNGAAQIDRFIRGPRGLGWPSADAHTWKAGAAYTKNGMFAWCGAFAAECLGRSGLSASIRYKHLASTSRLWAYCKGTPRDIPIEEARPGDLAVVSSGEKSYGEHITVITGVQPDEGLYQTVEGNARGLAAGDDGTLWEGVVKRTRPYRDLPLDARCPLSGRAQSMVVVKVYRFLLEDFQR